MPSQEDILLRNLVTKLSLDPESVREVLDAVKSAKQQEREILTDEERLIRQGLNASADAKKQRLLRELDEAEESIKRHYSKQQEASADNADRLTEIEANLAADMKTIRDRRERVEGAAPGEDPLGVEKSNEAIQRLKGAVQSVLPGIGLGFMTTALSAGVLAANIAQGVDRLRDMDTISRGIAAGAGIYGTGFFPGMTGGLQALRAMTEGGITPDDAKRVMPIFTPIMADEGPMGAARLTQAVEQSFTLGAAFGVSEQLVAKTMVMMRKLDDVPFEDLGEKFTELGNKAFKAGFPVGEYTEHVIKLTEQTKRYGIGLDDNAQMVSLFARELQTGVVTLQDIVRMQLGLANTQAGTRGGAIQMMMDRGLLTGRAAEELEAVREHPAAMEIVGRRIMEGGMGQEARQSLLRSTSLLGRRMAEDMARETGGGPGVVSALTDRFRIQLGEMFGLTQQGQTVQAALSMMDAAEQNKAASKGFMDAAQGFENLAQARAVGLEIIRDSVGAIEELHKDLLPKIYEGMVEMGQDREKLANKRAGQIAASLSLAPVDRDVALRGLIQTLQSREGMQTLEDMAGRLQASGFDLPSVRGMTPDQQAAFVQAVGRAAPGGGRVGLDVLGMARRGDEGAFGVLKLLIDNNADALIQLQDVLPQGTAITTEERSAPGGTP